MNSRSRKGDKSLQGRYSQRNRKNNLLLGRPASRFYGTVCLFLKLAPLGTKASLLG